MDTKRLYEEDCSLLNRIRRRDDRAIALLNDRYSMAVYSMALRVLRDPTLAEQVLSDIFMDIWGSPKPLMHIAATNLYPSMVMFARNRAVAVLIHKPPTEIEFLFHLGVGNQQDWEMTREKALALIEGMPVERRTTLERAFFHGVT
ncbi:RNA polymerase subunit sigma-24 [Telmatobacter sp. DSM 110680]|uniref:RNA polymerase subunit sigma-24 n=1 Tax=Telmatobacter sp. DSM 110680 TaxID=3036704 RepID=A0AAU7DJZ1_9BACT